LLENRVKTDQFSIFQRSQKKKLMMGKRLEEEKFTKGRGPGTKLRESRKKKHLA